MRYYLTNEKTKAQRWYITYKVVEIKELNLPNYIMIKFSSAQLLCRIWCSETPWTAARRDSLCNINS